MYPHRIHLRGPWICEPLAQTVLHADGQIETLDTTVPSPCSMSIPCRWGEGGLGQFAGRVRFRRYFHWPSQLDYYERLWLTFAGADYFTTVWLNGEKLGQHEGAFDPFEYELTSLVGPRNELIVEVDLPAYHPDAQQQRMLRAGLPEHSGGLWGEVRLEVRREAFLRNLRLWATFPQGVPVLHVAGEVVGEAEQPLELYVLLEEATILYAQVQMSVQAQPFHVATEVGSVERWWPMGLGPARWYAIRVELVAGASKLDSQTRRFGFRELAGDGRDGKLTVNGREVELSKHVQIVSLPVPLQDSGFWETESLYGGMHWLTLPLKDGFATDAALRAEAVRQARAIVTHLQHHPGIVGWTCHVAPQPHDVVLDEAIYQAVTALDPTRPCWQSG